MWKIFDYVNDRNVNEIAAWTRKLQKPQRTKVRVKIDWLEKAGADLPPGLLMKTETEYISKLKIQGNPKLRPMLCRQHLKFTEKESGEEIDEEVFILLIGAKEISWEFDPQGADAEAAIRRRKVISNPNQRLCKHERIS